MSFPDSSPFLSFCGGQPGGKPTATGNHLPKENSVSPLLPLICILAPSPLSKVEESAAAGAQSVGGVEGCSAMTGVVGTL